MLRESPNAGQLQACPGQRKHRVCCTAAAQINLDEEEAYIDSTAGAQFSARIDYGIERTAVLMWEDLETNTIFRLRGVLSKEDILYMAESMTRSEKSNKT